MVSLAAGTAAVVCLCSPAGLASGALAAVTRAGELSGQPVCATTPPSRVHYPPRGERSNRALRELPSVAALPTTAGLVGHLFYYSATPWDRQRLGYARIYAGGATPVTHVGMKILWTARKSGFGPSLLIVGAREDASGSFAESVPATTPGSNAFPSGIDAPEPGCWLLTLKTGRLIGTVTLLAESP